MRFDAKDVEDAGAEAVCVGGAAQERIHVLLDGSRVLCQQGGLDSVAQDVVHALEPLQRVARAPIQHAVDLAPQQDNAIVASAARRAGNAPAMAGGQVRAQGAQQGLRDEGMHLDGTRGQSHAHAHLHASVRTQAQRQAWGMGFTPVAKGCFRPVEPAQPLARGRQARPSPSPGGVGPAPAPRQGAPGPPLRACAPTWPLPPAFAMAVGARCGCVRSEAGTLGRERMRRGRVHAIFVPERDRGTFPSPQDPHTGRDSWSEGLSPGRNNASP